MGGFMKSYKLYFGWLLVTLLFAQSAWGESSFRKTIWPLKFENIDLSETENQEETWNLLLKYKLFARGLSDGTGIVFAGQEIFITDEVGYSGSATGNFKMGGNSKHRLGGPLLFGGEFINETGEDTISTGPTRFLGAFSPKANGKEKNAFKGKFCFDGGFDATNTAAGMKGEILDETACESDEVVPFVDITLDVPILSEDVSPKYHEAILADGKTRYIHVPPYTESDLASFNYFVESIQFANNGKLYVVMPPGGRLTKVFLKNTLSGIGTTAETDILVVEAKSESAWNEADSTWDVSDANITVVENSNYAGNLLFYTPQDITIGAGQKQMQGTYISGGTISFAQHTNFAGQLLAKAIIIDANFSAKDFRYVPFDPPVLNLDPTALATGRFLENDQIQTVPVSLDTLSATDVAFNYCFVLSAEENANQKLLANANDFDTKDMPICAVGADGLISGDSGIVYINKGSLTPTAETAVKLLVKADNLIEGDESFKLYIFNMSGAVLPGNKRSGFFTLFIQDADDNLPPVFDKTAYSFDVDENSPVGTLIGTVLATDPNKGDAVRYYLEKDTNLFVLDPETGNISVDQAVLDYESKDTTYSFNIYATDGKMNSDLVTVTIHVKDVNEEPSLSDTAFSVAETAAVGDVVGTLDGIDPDSLNKAFSTLSYKLIGESLTFEVASSGVISVKGALDYETTPVYSLRVEVSDGEYGDTATVTIHILDVNEEPVASDVVVQISENCQGCAADKTVPASDPDGDNLFYQVSTDTSGLFTIDATGLISLKTDKTLDYEQDSVYALQVSVTDAGGLSATVTVTVKVVNVNEEPVASDVVVQISENCQGCAADKTVPASDPDGDNLFYQVLTDTSGLFTIDSLTGLVSLKTDNVLDYEQDSVYMLQVSVRDSAGLSDTANVTVRVLDVNEEPVASDVVVQISENCQGCAADKTVPASDPDGDNLFYQVLTDTSGLFTIDATGLISLKTDKTLDYEQDSVYALHVSVTDADGLSATVTVTVKVVNVNEKPVASDVVVQISENCQGCAVDKTVPASDPDGDKLVYKVLTDASGLFTIDSTGLISLKTGKALDYEQDSVYTLQVSVTDAGGLSDTANVTVRVLDANEKPVASDVVVQISENCQGCAADKTVPASDPDGDKFVYKVLTDASGLFTIDSLTGLISLKTGKALDYEQDSVYALQVSVTDVGGLSDTAKVTVRVLDVNEKPTVYDVVVNIPEDCDGCMADRNVSASDPDGDKLVFRIVADTSGLFTIDSLTGRISLRNGNVLDYEKNSVYKIQASATDPSGLSDTATVTINVLNKTEKVEIIQVESGDSTWKKPDTVYTNNSRADVTYTTPEGNRDTTVSLKEGKNIIVVRYQDGSDTVVVLLNTQIPEVKISASSDSTGRISGVTIVEQKDADDTASYVRSNDPVISVSVTDRSGKKAESKTSQIKIHLDTVFVSKDKLQEAEKTIGKVTLSDESDLSSAVKVSHQVVGENKIQVSYDDTTAAGIVVKVSYFTDSDGKRLTDENGEEYYEVSTSFKNATGTQIQLTYTVDALGTVKSDRDGKTIYKVSYATESAADKTTGGVYQVEVSYLMNSSGEISLDEGGNVPYAVRYVYTDVYGNSAFAETKVIVDTVPPKVKILSPENASVVSNVSIEVRWTVNDIEQDTLTYQGLNEGKNVIIRTYRDKAGNEASDSVVVILSSGKLIEVEIADPLVAPDAKTVEKFTSASNSEPGTSYALSVYNAKTGKEEELQAGSKEGKSEGSHKEPYEGLSGKHLGVTLEIGAQAPAIDETGTLSTLESIVENGYVALDSGGGWDRTMTTVEDYVENYCSADFRRAYDSIGTAASLYKTKITIKIWFFTTIGDFVDDYSFTQEISPDHVDKTGAIQMYFELKPDGDGFLRNSDGRLLGTGAYIFNTDVKIRSQLQCELPDHERGYIRKDDDRILTKWGYRRPNQ